MVLEEQLRELLDKLDLTCAMKSSGSRSKRAKLLKKEIAVLRNKLSRQHSEPPPAESGIGSFEEEGARLGQETGQEGKHVLSVGLHSPPEPRRALVSGPRGCRPRGLAHLHGHRAGGAG